MAGDQEKRRPALTLNLGATRRSQSTDSTSTSSSLDKGQRTPRFAEATSVYSPVETRRQPFSQQQSQSQVPQSQPGDVGFGYIGSNRESVTMPMSPRSPLKSAMKVPGTPGRSLANPLSPTFREEQVLETREASTEKQQARDLKVKTRVRMAKFMLRGVNFSCSLIILSMITTSFTIFRATQSLPPQNGLPPWASNTKTWPQKVVLACSCFSLLICIGVFVGYCRGGHRRAEKVGVYYTLFAVGWFVFSMIMWAAAAGILQFSKNNSNNKDMWGWACVQNTRSQLFSDKIDYALVCRLQNWSLLCIIIELVVEVISIILYSVVFYRYWTKRKLHKSMDMRDKARSDLYLAQLRSQSAPNTPGFGPKSPAFSQYALSPRFPPAAYQSMSDVEAGPTPFTPGGKGLIVPQSSFAQQAVATASPQPAFKLQAPPTKAKMATPTSPKVGFNAAFGASPADAGASPASSSTPPPQVQDHAPMVDGEQQYAAVPIPGAYAGQAVKSPPAAQTTFQHQYR